LPYNAVNTAAVSVVTVPSCLRRARKGADRDSFARLLLFINILVVTLRCVEATSSQACDLHC
jgi:hypothetical protein